MNIQIKRVYDNPDTLDGVRILVDRLWPRGLSKEKARLDYWAKDVAPSNALRTWYQHDREKWDEFKRRYRTELNGNPDAVEKLKDHFIGESITLLFSSRELELNNAVALKDYLEGNLG